MFAYGRSSSPSLSYGHRRGRYTGRLLEFGLHPSGCVQVVTAAAPSVQFESEPPGADVRTAQGQTCLTPCSLAVPLANQSVTFAMNGYVPQTVQVAVQQPEALLVQHPAAEYSTQPGRSSAAGAPHPRHARQAKPKPRKMVARPKPAAPRSAAPPPADDDGSHTAIDRRPRAAAGSRTTCLPAAAGRVSPSPFPPPPQPRISRAGSCAPGKFWTIRALSGTMTAYLVWRCMDSVSDKPAKLGTRRRRRAAGAGRSVRPRHLLSARLGDRPLRFPLRLLHGGKHVLSAQGRGAHAGRARPAVLGLRRARRAQASPHRRRAAGPARHHDARSIRCRATCARARSTN